MERWTVLAAFCVLGCAAQESVGIEELEIGSNCGSEFVAFEGRDLCTSSNDLECNTVTMSPDADGYRGHVAVRFPDGRLPASAIWLAIWHTGAGALWRTEDVAEAGVVELDDGRREACREISFPEDDSDFVFGLVWVLSLTADDDLQSQPSYVRFAREL